MQIVPIASTIDQVQFACPAGGAVGTWKGTPQPPLGQPVDVEFSVEAVLRWDAIVRVDESAAGFAIEGSRILIRGRVDAVGEEGVVTLNVAGAVLLVEFLGDPPEDILGATIELPETRLDIYPTGS
jgi:hypothetical protein